MVGIKSDGHGLNRPRRRSGSEQPIASLGFATQLDSDVGNLEQPQRQVIQHCWIAAFELELDLAEWFDGTAIGGANLALIDGNFNSRGSERLEFDDPS
jgi:hypothetical protein